MIGKAIKYMRIKKEINQEQLAKLINGSQQNISRYENNQRIISFETLEQIAKLCGYKIYFDNGKERFQIKDLERKDI